jgi:hypothetical protein
MLNLASAESLLGSIFFATTLALIGALSGYLYCRKGSK